MHLKETLQYQKAQASLSGELRKYPFVTQRESTDADIQNFLKENNINIQSRYHVVDDLSTISMVANGFGMCIMPELGMRHIPYDVKCYKIVPEAYRIVGIAAINPEFMAPAVRTMYNHILNKYYDRFIVYPAASKNHHCCLSGLLYHTISMAAIAMMISSYYQTIDKDVLLTGVILHDVGKVMELSGPIATKYTLEGRLLGHISIMVGEIRIAAKEENISGEIPLLLEHMILSHHGNKDFGSPILPLTREAVVLHFVDDLDSKMNILDKAYDDVEEGEFTQRIIALDGRAFYKPKKNSF